MRLAPLWILGSVLGYVVFFAIIYPISGLTVTALSAFPVMIVGWYFGFKAASLAGITTPFINLLLIHLIGNSGWQTAIEQSGPIALVILVAGATVGWLCDQDKAIQRNTRHKEHYRQAIIAAGAVPYYRDYVTNTYSFIGEGFAEIVGYPVEEIVPDLWEDIRQEIHFTGALAGLSIEEAGQRILTGAVHEWKCDILIRTRSGENRWVNDSSLQIRNEHGKRIASVGIIQDIAERKHAEEALHASEERYRALYQDNPSMFFTVDAEGIVISVNKFGATQLGYTPEELEGQVVLKVFHEDDRSAVFKQLKTCLQNPGKAYGSQFRKIRKDGSLLWVKEFSRAVSGSDSVTQILLLCQDISEAKQAEEGLHQFQQRLKALQEVSIELSKAQTIKNLIQQAIELGRNRLGFDRLSLWLVDDSNEDYMIGTFGTDEHGQIRDEWDLSLLIPQMAAYKDMLSGKTSYYLWEDTPLFDHQHKVVGMGWNAMAVLWGDGRGIGWLSADNLIQQQPVLAQQLELLSLYGSTLGHVIKRKQTEEALRTSEERYRSLYRDNPSMFFTLDSKGTVISVNKFGASQLGYTVEELVHQSVLKVFYEDDRATVLKQLEQCLQNPGQVFQWQIRKVRKDGSLLWVQEFAREVKSPTNEPHVLIVCQDISERKHTHDALLLEQERFRYVTMATRDAIYDWDIRANVVLRNEAYQTLYSPDQPIGRDVSWWEEHIHPEDRQRVLHSIKNAFRARDHIWSSEYRFLRHDGDYATVIDRGYIIFDETDEPLRMIGAIRDITERKKAEQQRLELAIEREKVGFLQDFLGSMAHDLKTPIAGVEMNFAILERLYTSEETQHWIELINKQLVYLSAIIDDVLTIARLETLPDLSFENVNINQLVRDIKTSLESRISGKNLTLTLTLDADLPPVHACRDELYRALMNLLENAVKYTPEQGSVNIHTHTLDSQVIAEISDTGIGISESHLSRIFDEFYRAENGRAFASGTGLGLAITKKIIELHQGTIAVDSSVGEGTTFRVSLPVLN